VGNVYVIGNGGTGGASESPLRRRQAAEREAVRRRKEAQ
jgi:hypothetical protein